MKCTVEGCSSKRHCKGFCRNHYERWRRHGSTDNLNWKGGIRAHRMYGAWHQMINRCENSNNSSYPRYGALGITVCERWHDFRNFLADMGERPSGKTLDRINPYGPYAPENCRWATIVEQRANMTAEGQKRMQDGVSKAKKEFWANKRAAGDFASVRHGDSHPFAKLNAKTVRAIRSALEGGITKYRLAKTYGVAIATISDIAYGRTWKHVE